MNQGNPRKRTRGSTGQCDKDFEPEAQYVYVPGCSRCRDRGFVCQTTKDRQGGDHACGPCRLKKLQCSANRGQDRIVKQGSISVMKGEPLAEPAMKDMPHFSGTTELTTSQPSKRQCNRTCSDSDSSLSDPAFESELPKVVEKITRSSSAILHFSLSEHTRSLDEMTATLDKNIQEFYNQVTGSQESVKQVASGLTETIRLLDIQNPKTDLQGNFPSLGKINDLITELVDSQTKANGLAQQLRAELSSAQKKSDDLSKMLYVQQQKLRCQALYAEGKFIDAAQLFLTTMWTECEDVVADWPACFRTGCIRKLERQGDEEIKAGEHDKALAAYSTALSLHPAPPNDILSKWAKIILLRGSTNDVLDSANKFELPRFKIYREICLIYEADGRISKAIECFQQMQTELASEADVHDERVQWEQSLQQRCAQTLGRLSSSAMDSKNFKEATEHFSTMLSLDVIDRTDILIKRSKAWAMMNSWENALKDADEVIKLKKPTQQDEKKHAEVVEAFETLLLKLK